MRCEFRAFAPYPAGCAEVAQGASPNAFEVFNNLHFTFADWWGSLGPNPGGTVTYYPGTNLMMAWLCR